MTSTRRRTRHETDSPQPRPDARNGKQDSPAPKPPDFTVRPFGRCGPLDPDQAATTVIRRWSLRVARVPGRSEQRDDLE